jgi:phosphatidylinositol alpha-1,6-mannosyltransferase
VLVNSQLLLAYDFPPIGGGIARMMGELARRYPPGTLLVSTGQHEGGPEFDASLPNKVDRLEVPSRRLRTVQGLVRWSYRAARLARSAHPEFVWCGNLKPAGYPARWIRKRVGTPYGILLYGTDILLLRDRIQHSALKRTLARTLIAPASVLVAISRWTRAEALSLLEDLGLNDKTIEVRLLPLGTDPEHFRPRVDPSSVRARYGLPEGRWLLTVARLAAHKGIDTVMHVLAALRELYPDLRYLVVGRGDRLSHLQGLARDLGVADRVRFLTDVPDSDLPALYNTAEIYLGLSRSAGLMMEGFGISLSEASASGIPVIAGSGGGIPDAVRDGETGLLVDAEGPDAAIAAVRLLLGDRELARRLGAEGRRAVETYYNWQRVTTELAGIGHELGKSPRQEVVL